jgi:hypothetical protein
MPRMAPDSLEEGMVLSQPVTNANGVVMLPEGAELTKSMIQKMLDMDIECAYVKGAPREGGSLEQMLTDLDARFRKAEKAPHMAAIKKIVREHIESLYG